MNTEIERIDEEEKKRRKLKEKRVKTRRVVQGQVD